MVKLLVTPPIMPIGIPAEADLQGEEWMTKKITLHGAELTQWSEQLRDGAPEHFHAACGRLLQSFSGKAHSILVGGTTGEGIGLGPRQYEVLLRAMQKACPPDIRILAGLLGRDDMIKNQIRIASALGIDQFVLGLNHTGDNQRRFDDALSMFDAADRLWLYNMPTFDPASLEFITRCAEDLRVQGIKDSSKWTDALKLRMLLQLKERRPDFQVLAGNEEAYGALSDEDFAKIDGLVSGNSNADADLLLEFTQNPKDPEIARRRRELHDEILSLSSWSGGTPATGIEKHILGLKLRLKELGILESKHVALYSSRGSLFQTHPELALDV